MHKFSSVLVLLAVVAASTALTADETKQFQVIIGNCVQAEGATEEHMENMMNMVVPTAPAEMCLHACMMEATGLIVDGKFNAANAIAGAQKMTNHNEGKVAIAAEISQECADKLAGGDPDRCVYAKMIVECNGKAAQEHGISQKDLLSP